jgi:hypothetical protein
LTHKSICYFRKSFNFILAELIFVFNLTDQ